MEIRQLGYFMAIADEMSFSSAARKLYISQSALSKAIKQLEDELQVQLFVYKNKKLVALTEKGKILYEKSQNIMNEYKSIVEEIASDDTEVNGAIHLGFPLRLGLYMLAPVLEGFSNDHPEWNLTFSTGGSKRLRNRLMREELDMAVIVSTLATEPDEAFCYQKIGGGPMHVYMHKEHPLAQKEILSYKDLQEENMLLLDNDYESTSAVLNSCAQFGFQPKVKMTFNTTVIILNYIKRNMGIGIFADIYPPIEEEDVVSRPLCDGINTYDFSLITRKNGYQSKAVRALKEYIVEEGVHP